MAGGVDLSSRQQLNEFNRLIRADRVDTHLHRVSVCSVWVIAVAAFLMFGVLVLHLVLPTRMRFLDADEYVNHSAPILGFLGGVLIKGTDRFFGK